MKKTLKIEGMMCEKCCKRVRKALEATDGVISAVTNLENSTAAVELSGDVSADVLAKAVTDAGYTFAGIV